MPVSITIDIDDAQIRRFFSRDGFVRAFNKRFAQRLAGFHSHMKAQIKQQMRSGSYPPLGLQQFIAAGGPKSPTKTLRDTDGLMNALRAHYARESEYVTGMDFTFEGTNAKGFPYAALAKMLEEGRTWTPTQGERLKLFLMARDSAAPEPDGKPKMTWSIPGRPFLTDTFSRPEVLEDFVNKRVFEAIRQAVDDLAAGR